MSRIKIGKSQRLWQAAKKIIPGGGQLLSKRAEMFLPELWPAYYRRAKGVEVIDLDGRKYIDMTIMGVGSCILGYADPDVNRAVKQAIDNGSMCTLNSPAEVELARTLLKLHPWAGLVRFGRTGGEAVTIAVRIARAASGKDQIAFCGYHGWHDWYISGNLASQKNLDGHLLPGLIPNGVPRGLLNSALPFQYNHPEQLEKILKKNRVGAIVMEVMRHQEPANNFLQKVRAMASKYGAVLVFDEVTSGFRMRIGGLHQKYKITPDMVVYGKALGNGFPIAAVLGKRTVMDAAQTTFISSTHWTERIGPTAALATIKKMQSKNVPRRLDKIGRLIGAGWSRLARRHGLDISVLPPAPLITMSINYPNKLELKTLFTQEMLKRGFLAGPSVYVCYAHREHHVKKYLRAVDEVFGIMRRALDSGNVKKWLQGPVAHSGFARLT